MRATAVMPSRSLRWFARASKWLFGLALAGWIAFVLTALLLHGLIVPRIDQLRPWLEQRATRALGAPVVIGRITAHSSGWLPSFELGGVAVLDAAGRPVLQAQRVLATVSARSLWRAGLEQLYVEQPQLELRRAADGRFSIGSLQLGGGADADAAATPDDDRFADWLLAQPELVLEQGQLSFFDERGAGVPPLVLAPLRLVLRNDGRRHMARLDATPPDAAGRPVTLIARLREPLLHRATGRWRALSGELFAEVPQLDLPRLNAHLDALPALDSGQAALRLWAGLRRGRLVDATVDAAVLGLRTTLARSAAGALDVARLSGRFDWRALPRGHELQAQQLELQLGGDRNGAWPGRTLRLSLQEAGAGRPARGELAADRIDLALLTRLARLARGAGVPDALDALLLRLAPKGSVEAFAANWQGPADDAPPQRFQVRGRARALEFAAQPSTAPASGAGIPGVRGASADFEFDQDGGSATVSIEDGTATFPGVFEDPVVAIARLRGRVDWKSGGGGQWRVDVPELRLENADTAGRARFTWRSSDPASAKSRSRFPGEIDLDANLERGNLARVHRYLPLDLPAAVRHYVRDALVAGSAGAARFHVRGPIREIPFSDPGRGEFTITANVRDATFAYAPPGVQPRAEPPWPPLTQVAAELRFERAALQVGNAQGRFGAAPGPVISAASASIANLDHPLVAVDATLQAALPQLLKTLRTTPLDALTEGALARARASGDAQLRLRLALPIDQLGRSTVRGSLALRGNDVQVVPGSPWLRQVSGSVAFTERGFSLEDVGAQLYGGPVRLEGGGGGSSGTADGAAALAELRARGTFDTAGLARDAQQQQQDAGAWLQPLARIASGSAQYEATLRVRRGGTELSLGSDLRGLALALPPPLAKPADAALPLRLSSGPAATGAGAGAADDLLVSLGDSASLHYQRAADGRALRGSLTLGLPAQPAAPLPATGVDARVDVAQLDVDGWTDVLERLQDGGAGGRTAAAADDGDDDAAARSYWPSRWQARIGQLDAAGFRAHRVTLQGTRAGTLWRSHVTADELAGAVEFRESAQPGGPGRLRARLARLLLTETDARSDGGGTAPAAPRHPQRLPALDVVIEDFESNGRRLGRVEIDAANRQRDAQTREWRLNRLALRLPEAQLSASGEWLQPVAAARGAGAAAAPPTTALDFQLDINDSGRLLARFGMPGVLRSGRGALAGRLSWHGSPLGFDAPSLDGRFHVDVDSGQFLKADPGLAKLLGVLSLQALPRRLSLDFRDLFSQGFAFDFVRGDVGIASGVATTNNLQMKGASAAVLMEGSADVARETQDLRVVVVPEIDAGTAALVATAINPAIGLGTFLAQYFLKKPLSAAATQEFRVAGSWDDPQIAKVARRAAAPLPAPSVGPAQ